MKQLLKWLAFAVSVSALANCSSATNQIPHEVAGKQRTPTEAASAPSVPNVFAAARGKALKDSDLDQFITAPLSASDRAIAHQLMNFMPPDQRGDFLYMTSDGRVISNNAALLEYAHVASSPSGTVMTLARRKAATSGVRRAMDYSSSCSPTDPYAGTGPYTRQVSGCGFSAGWAFLKIPCGTTTLNQGDYGYTYFEITGPSNSSHIEGGMFTPDGTTFDPYLRSDAISANNGYETLTNSAARYPCDEQMAIFHGVTNTVPDYSYTQVGDASQYDPYTAWVDSQTITLSNAAWLFGPVPSSIAGAGTDAAGYMSPCMNCSISQVTALAQPYANGSWNADASEFGIDSNGNNAIQWLQVAFGNWDTDCQPGTSLCTFHASSDPFVYYGGSQAYPDGNVAGSNFNPTNYGPYETVDGIQAYGGLSSSRAADIAISEPLPPPPCTLDSDGMCAVNTQSVSAQCTIEVMDPKTRTMEKRYVTYTNKSVYATYRSSTLLGLATKTTNEPYNGCTPITTNWSPAEPRVTYNDANLP